jgi:hypothetical protein
MTQQLDLEFDARKQELDTRLQDLINALRGNGWQTAAQLRSRGFTDRELRELVEHDERGEVLSFPGSPGYKRFDEATIPEIERAIALKNQARRMLVRHIRYQRRRHGRL